MPVDAGAMVPITFDNPVSTSTTTSTRTTVERKSCQPPSGHTGTRGGSDGTVETAGTYAGAADGGVTKGTPPVVPPTPAPGGAGEATSTNTTTSASTGGGGCSMVVGGLPNAALVVLGLCAALAMLTRKRDTP
jgi:hypothetical protein